MTCKATYIFCKAIKIIEIIRIIDALFHIELCSICHAISIAARITFDTFMLWMSFVTKCFIAMMALNVGAQFTSLHFTRPQRIIAIPLDYRIYGYE